MTISLGESRRRARHRRALGYAAVAIGLYLSLWVGTSVTAPEWMRMPMLFLHLISVIAGLGATVVLDVKALFWTAGRASIDDVRHLEHSVTPLTWMGILGLLFSGAFLSPDLHSPLTAIKMIAVLVAALNGIAVGRLTDELRRLPSGTRFWRTPARLRWWCLGTATTSQIAWWTAVLIGMLNTAGR
jgi:hypothetical protein